MGIYLSNMEMPKEGYVDVRIKYADDLTIDRIDVSKGYFPDNCRWVSVREQNNNQARTLWLTYNGETMQLSY